MTHETLKLYLKKVIAINPNALVTYEGENEEYNINSVFSYHDGEDGYYEIYSDLGFDDNQEEVPAMTATEMLRQIEDMEKDEEIPLDTRIDIIAGNEDGEDTLAEEAEELRIIFTDSAGNYIPHKKNVLRTASALFSDNESISLEEKRNESLKEIIEESISDMSMDFSENGGSDMTTREQETSAMFEYTERELIDAEKHLYEENKYQIFNTVSYDYDTPKEVIAILEKARKFKEELRLDYGHTNANKDNNGVSWGVENNIFGTIGNSKDDTISLPLLITDTNTDGEAILNDCIVAICDKDGNVLYKHNNYKPVMDWENAIIEINSEDDFPFSIKGYSNKENKEMICANFKTKSEAMYYLAEKLKFEKPAEIKKKPKQNTNNTEVKNNFKKR